MPRMALTFLITMFTAGVHAQSVAADDNPRAAAPATVTTGAETTHERDAKPLRRAGAAKPASVSPAQPATQSGWRSVAALAAVIALILLLAWGYRTAIGQSAISLMRGAPQSGVLQIISRTSLAPRQSICLVRAGSRIVLVGLSADRMTTLDVISDPDAVAALSGQAAAARRDSRSSEFRKTLNSEQAAAEVAANERGETGDDQTVVRLRDQLAGTLQRLRLTSEGH